jgi:stage V sporulation protein B
MKTILAVSIPISLASIVAAINRNIDTFTVMNGLKIALAGMYDSAEMITNEATRLYGILSGRVDTLIGLPTAINVAFATALVPAVSESMAKGDEKTAKKRVTFSFRTTLLIALPCAIGMAVLAGPILELLFPNVHAIEAPRLLQISAFTVIFTLINQTIGGALQGLGKVMVPAASMACGAIVKLILNLTLIRNPQIGIYGAAFSSVASSCTVTIIEMFILTKALKFSNSKTQMIFKPILATLIMGIAAYASHWLIATYLFNNAITTLIAILIAVIAYFLAVLGLKIFDREDYHMLPYGDKIYRFLEKVKLVKS